jgi:hypothetical protein
MVIMIFLSHSAAADEIHLQNGRIIKTLSFWEDGGERVFEKYGNTVVLPKASVKEIRTTHFESAAAMAPTLFWKDPVSGMEFKWIRSLKSMTSDLMPPLIPSPIGSDFDWSCQKRKPAVLKL